MQIGLERYKILSKIQMIGGNYNIIDIYANYRCIDHVYISHSHVSIETLTHV